MRWLFVAFGQMIEIVVKRIHEMSDDNNQKQQSWLLSVYIHEREKQTNIQQVTGTRIIHFHIPTLFSGFVSDVMCVCSVWIARDTRGRRTRSIQNTDCRKPHY
jgi:hypothetical protein